MKENKIKSRGKFFNNPDFADQRSFPETDNEFMQRMQGAKTTDKKNDKIVAKYFGETKEDA